MCGIAGAVGSTADIDRFRTSLDGLAHRGPDSRGEWRASSGQAVWLGHRRLAVVDLSDAGAQPMHSASAPVTVVFNGEIYNHAELRRELRSEGVIFRSSSDTEVVLEGYRVWGDRVVDKLVGMFAFAVWDDRSKSLFLARDRSGEKPLYYAAHAKGFYFASELGPFTTVGPFEISADAVALYLQYQYVPAPHSMLEGVCKLMPGHAARFERDRLSIWRYWDPLELLTRPPRRIGPAAAADEFAYLFGESVRGQMIADVPLGAFLSGGYDSTAVVSEMVGHSGRPVRTFTIGFDVPGHDEVPFAAEVARHLGTEHESTYLTERDALDLVPLVPGMYAEPFADSSSLPTHLVSRVARRAVTVALSGDGGDELFGGYTRYAILRRAGFLFPATARLRRPIALVARLLPNRVRRAADILTCPDIEHCYNRLVSIASPEVVSGLTGRNTSYLAFQESWRALAGRSLTRRAAATDFSTYLPEAILTKVDRAAMAASLETRAPFLDHRLIEFSFSLPDELIIDKRLVKNFVHARVPRAVMDRPKKGFSVPLARWFRTDLRELLDTYLQPQYLEPLGVTNGGLIRSHLTEHQSGVRSHTGLLWALLVLSLWGQGWKKLQPSESFRP